MTLSSISSAVSQSTLLQQRQRRELGTAERLPQAPRATDLLSRTAEQTARQPQVNASQGLFEPARPSGLGKPRDFLGGPRFPTPGGPPGKDESKVGKPVDPLPPDPVEDYSESAATLDATSLHNAVDGFGTDEATVYEVLEGKSPAQIELIRQQYQEVYGEDLDAVLRDDFSGDELARLDEVLLGAPYLLERNKQLASQSDPPDHACDRARATGAPA